MIGQWDRKSQWFDLKINKIDLTASSILWLNFRLYRGIRNPTTAPIEGLIKFIFFSWLHWIHLLIWETYYFPVIHLQVCRIMLIVPVSIPLSKFVCTETRLSSAAWYRVDGLCVDCGVPTLEEQWSSAWSWNTRLMFASSHSHHTFHLSQYQFHKAVSIKSEGGNKYLKMIFIPWQGKCIDVIQMWIGLSRSTARHYDYV